MTLRVEVDSCRPADLSALNTILLGGTPAICRNRLLWIQAVKDHFDDVPLLVSCCKLLQLVCETAPQVGYDVYLVDPGGCHQLGDLVALCRGSILPSLVVECMSPLGQKCIGQSFYFR